MSILTDIYDGEYRAPHSRPPCPQELEDNDLAFWDKAAEALGLDAIDAHMNLLHEKQHLTDIHHFREGFKLGVQLMLEVFSTQ